MAAAADLRALDDACPWLREDFREAWNLVARSRRTHQLKHVGWTPLRTPRSTVWFSPGGHVVEVPRHAQAPPGVGDPAHAVLPDPDALAAVDAGQRQVPEETRPWLPHDQRQDAVPAWLEPAPF